MELFGFLCGVDSHNNRGSVAGDISGVAQVTASLASTRAPFGSLASLYRGRSKPSGAHRGQIRTVRWALAQDIDVSLSPVISVGGLRLCHLRPCGFPKFTLLRIDSGHYRGLILK